MRLNNAEVPATGGCADTPALQQGALAVIVAVADNGVIGKGNALPWRLSADLRYFKQRTLGKPIVMGRKTWESIGRPLPGRENIVISRDSAYQAEGAVLVPSLEAALAHCDKAAEIMIIGGASIYEQVMPMASRLYLTRVHLDVEGGDAFFDMPSLDGWTVRCNHFLPGENGEPDCTFQVYDRLAT
ncbi:MAG: dihydrofolate reductase [Pseudomonadota bacterium]